MMKKISFSARRLEKILGSGKRTTTEKEAKRVREDKQMFRESKCG